MTDVFWRRRYWKQWVEIRVITEDGVYAALDDQGNDQVPADYDGAQIVVEVVQRIIFADRGGNLTELRLDDLANVKDADGKTGIGAEVMDDEGLNVVETIDPTGTSTHKTKWYVRYAAGMTEEQMNKAKFVKQLVDEQITSEG